MTERQRLGDDKQEQRLHALDAKLRDLNKRREALPHDAPIRTWLDRELEQLSRKRDALVTAPAQESSA